MTGDVMKRIGKNVVVSVVGLLLIFVTYWYFGQYQRNMMSMTFLIIIFGTLVTNLIVWKQHWIFGNIKDMPILTVQFYYSEVFSTLRAIFTGFVIAFAILWGTQYASGQHNNYDLQLQTALLLAFLAYVGFASFYTFIQDFKLRIGE